MKISEGLLYKHPKVFYKDQSGAMAMIAAIAFMLIIGCAGIVIDFSRKNSAREATQGALDAAVLKMGSDIVALGGSPTAMELQQVKDAAKQLFAGNLVDQEAVTTVQFDLDLDSNGNIVGLFSGTIGTTLAKFIVGDMSFSVDAKAAIWTQGTTACIVALNPTMPEAIKLSGTADIISQDCSVYSNSTAVDSISQTGSSSIDAMEICTAGDYVGSNYTPMPQTGCPQLRDPFVGLIESVVDARPACTNSGHGFGSGTHPEGVIQPGHNVCGTWNLNAGADLPLLPGLYYAYRLEMGANSTLRGTDVTIILYGGGDPYTGDSYLNVQSGASLQISAPSTGATAGIVLAQDPRAIYFTQENTIIGGGSIDPSGIIYLPTRELNITGAGDIALNSDQFALIVDHIYMYGNGVLRVKGGANFQAAGLPPLPSSQGEGLIRLVY